MHIVPRRLPTINVLAVLSLVLLTACTATGASTTPGSAGPIGGSSAMPSEPGGSGSDAPASNEPGPGGGGNPGVGGELTVPQPGQLDVHPVSADALEAAVDGRRVTVRVSWTSGVEPCYVLDSIVVDRSDATFAITVLEGHAPGDNVCIEIAKGKFALVELGELEAGTYTIVDATDGAAPIEVVVG